MPQEIDVFNLKKRISDRLEELTEIANKRERELEDIHDLLKRGQSLLLDLGSMEESMDYFIDKAGGYIEDN